MGQKALPYSTTNLLNFKVLAEMFPVMSYIQIDVSQGRNVKKMLHYNGDTHQAATQWRGRVALTWTDLGW